MADNVSRRALIGGSIVMVGMASQACAQNVPYDPEMVTPEFTALSERFGDPGLGFSLAMEVIARTGKSYDMGEGANGRRRLVEISGGRFRAEGVSGIVLPGGTDRQIFRSDGIRELDARYELKADDGSLLFVHNKVIIDSDRPAELGRYARSVVRVEAPDGTHDWLNRRLLIGTLDSLRPEQPYVYLRFYAVE